MFYTTKMYIWGIPRHRSRSGGNVSDLLRNFLYENTCRKIHSQFFLKFLLLLFLRYHVFQKKKSPLSKIWKNSHKFDKINQKFWVLLEDGGFKIAPVRKHQKFKKKTKIGMHSLHTTEQKSSS